jgi:hypothetical protein
MPTVTPELITDRVGFILDYTSELVLALSMVDNSVQRFLTT